MPTLTNIQDWPISFLRNEDTIWATTVTQAATFGFVWHFRLLVILGTEWYRGFTIKWLTFKKKNTKLILTHKHVRSCSLIHVI